MWKPAESLKWQRDGLCAKPSNKKYLDWFFPKDFSEKYDAKNLCYGYLKNKGTSLAVLLRNLQ